MLGQRNSPAPYGRNALYTIGGLNHSYKVAQGFEERTYMTRFNGQLQTAGWYFLSIDKFMKRTIRKSLPAQMF